MVAHQFEKPLPTSNNFHYSHQLVFYHDQKVHMSKQLTFQDAQKTAQQYSEQHQQTIATAVPYIVLPVPVGDEVELMGFWKDDQLVMWIDDEREEENNNEILDDWLLEHYSALEKLFASIRVDGNAYALRGVLTPAGKFVVMSIIVVLPDSVPGEERAFNSATLNNIIENVETPDFFSIHNASTSWVVNVDFSCDETPIHPQPDYYTQTVPPFDIKQYEWQPIDVDSRQVTVNMTGLCFRTSV